jgi:hydrogenase-4 component F
MGFLLVGIGLGTPLALFWVLFHILAHALVKTLLFFSAGILHQQYHSNQFEDMKDVFTLQPLAAWGLIIGSMAIIGVPLFPVFLSKLNILTQLADYSLPVLFRHPFVFPDRGCGFCRHSDPDNPANRRNKA